MPRMAKLLLQLQVTADARRHGPRRCNLLPLRHAAAQGQGSRFVLFCILALAAAANTLALARALHGAAAYDDDAASLPRAGGRFAVVINTWKRHALLRRTAAHYAACAGVDAVHVVWSEPGHPPESLRRSIVANSTTRRANVRFLVHNNQEGDDDDGLNTRFRPIPGLTTDAVFSVDDDLVVPCSTLRFAYSVWRSAPEAMVGFVPRMHWLLGDPRSTTEEYRYGSWWSVWWTGSYSMVLTKASFFHRRYLDLYTNHMPPFIREYVKQNRNCEDIAMSFLVANVTGAPPLWVQGRIYEIGSSGISSLKGHSLQRSRCLNKFAATYGHMPLVATTVKAVDSRRSWFW